MVYLSVGSNLGDREGNLRAAIDGLQGTLDVLAVSRIYETAPVGVTDQPPFLNLAVSGRTDREPRELLSLLKDIERAVGRTPTFRWGPRVVDIDIVLYGDLVMETPELTIPHRELANRAFVLVPLAEVASPAVHPKLSVTIGELAAGVDASGVRPW